MHAPMETLWIIPACNKCMKPHFLLVQTSRFRDRGILLKFLLFNPKINVNKLFEIWQNIAFKKMECMRLSLIALLSLLCMSAVAQNSRATILFDAFGKDTGLRQGWGYSVLIEHEGKRILFDAGSNANTFRHNLERMKIDAATIDMVIVSHAHLDHLNGIDYLLKINPAIKIYFPFDPFWGATGIFDARGRDSLVKDSLPRELRYFDGAADVFPVSQSGGRFWNANVEYIRQSVQIAPGLRIVVNSAHYLGYFSRYPGNILTNSDPHDCSDIRLTNLTELSLSVSTETEEILFVGCSHSGVENIVKQTRQEIKRDVSLVVGGFHLIPFDRAQITQLVELLRKEGVARVAPGHCSGHLAFKIFKDFYGKNFIYAGLGESIKF